MDDERVSQDPTAENETDAEDRNDGDTSGTAAPRPVKHQRRLLLFVIAGAVLAADLLTKILAVANIEPGRPVWLIGDIVSLRLVRNPGAAFSMATGMTWLLTLVAVGVVIGVVRIGRTLRSPWWALGLGLVLGGALGNLVDRFFRAPGVMQGHVVDFVSVGWWPVFNVADSGIVCGAILLVVLTLFGLNPDGTRGQADEQVESDSSAGKES